MQELQNLINNAAVQLFGVEIEPILSRPEEKFGDYSTNVALQLAAKIDNAPTGGPRAIAEQLAANLKSPMLSRIEVAGPGFINLWMSDSALVNLLDKQPVQKLIGQEIVVEYSDPNPFKILHVGHLYTSVVGDAIANLFEIAGANVHRVNFGGDVGLHVGKTMWAILQKLGGELPDNLNQISKSQRPQWLSDCYIAGNQAYDDNESAKQQIIELNGRIYQVQDQQDKTSPLAQIYWTTRQWSYDYFNEFYARIGSHFEKYYPESETVGLGMQAIKDNMGKVFEESEGAIVFKGDVHNLHTRVFVNSQGLPTYETKDVGLMLKKWQDYHFDKSVMITGNEIYEYMQVVFKAVEQFAPELVARTTHLTHGMVKLAGGVKMSSRLGNIIKAEDVLEAARLANQEVNQQDNDDTALGAIKYAFLKNRIGGDIIFDPKESVSLVGNSGPYLQYAHARARSIIGKAKAVDQKPEIADFETGERSLARKIGEYSEVVEKAVEELMPHHIASYLYELAQVFNRFYETNRVVDNPREELRLMLVDSYAKVLKNGLELLNIKAPERL